MQEAPIGLSLLCSGQKAAQRHFFHSLARAACTLSAGPSDMTSARRLEHMSRGLHTALTHAHTASDIINRELHTRLLSLGYGGVVPSRSSPGLIPTRVPVKALFASGQHPQQAATTSTCTSSTRTFSLLSSSTLGVALETWLLDKRILTRTSDPETSPLLPSTAHRFTFKAIAHGEAVPLDGCSCGELWMALKSHDLFLHLIIAEDVRVVA